MFIIKRIFMTAADNAGGSPPAPAQPAGGGQPAPAPAPAQPPAQGASPQQTVDVNAIASAVHDKVFAALRQSGVLGSKPRATTPPAPDAPPGAAADAPQVDLRSLDRTLGRTGHAARITEAQYRRVEAAYRAENPADTETWVKEYFEGWGAAPTPPAQAPNAPAGNAAPQQRSTTPVSDGGSPPAPTAPLEERDILSLSEEDREHLRKQKGTAWYRAQLAKQTKGKSIRLV